ncbi:MAG: N-acetyltransferase [Chloroflexi bacterium]|nr:MAG: N-acetyltransferase [Chloroflexota bacterium]MBL1193289.1 N-acetyltransferase [Chloroflexota bacterium]NOH10581.1 GNAT family N-acetyltransferase [Chloroflexota bacterium]
MSDPPEQEIPDKNLFMVCEQLNRDALSALSDVYHIRNCRKDELDIWKDMPFDDPIEPNKYRQYMTDFFSAVYTPKGDLFYKKCLFVCDERDRPIGTAFIWKAYDEFNTVHWLKVLKEHEGKGIGRALLSIIMEELQEGDYPVYLHTQPGSFRAVKLYSDFGFKLLSDPIIGARSNDLEECLPILEKHMKKANFDRLQIVSAPKDFLKKMKTEKENHF